MSWFRLDAVICTEIIPGVSEYIGHNAKPMWVSFYMPNKTLAVAIRQFATHNFRSTLSPPNLEIESGAHVGSIMGLLLLYFSWKICMQQTVTFIWHIDDITPSPMCSYTHESNDDDKCYGLVHKHVIQVNRDICHLMLLSHPPVEKYMLQQWTGSTLTSEVSKPVLGGTKEDKLSYNQRISVSFTQPAGQFYTLARIKNSLVCHRVMRSRTALKWATLSTVPAGCVICVGFKK